MRTKIIVLLFMLSISTGVMAQNSEKPASIVENTYMLPKRGMEAKFEAAVKAHNAKFHPAGPYVAGLRSVDYGDKAGWYVWILGPTDYSALDTHPTKEGGHDDDWSKTVDPLVESYGVPVIYEVESDYSYGMDIFKSSKHYELWKVKLNPGKRLRFEAILTRLKKTNESLANRAFLVFSSAMHTAEGADYGLIWSFTNFADWGKASGTKAAYEKIYGEGSWRLAIEEWNECVASYDSELRSFK